MDQPVKVEKGPKPPYIQFVNRKINFRYNILYKREEEGNVSCYIPPFDMYFSAPSKEVARERGYALVRDFFRFWITVQGWKKFILQIHALGFRTENHDFIMKQLLNNRPEKSKFTGNAKIFDSDFTKDGVEREEVEELVEA